MFAFLVSTISFALRAIGSLGLPLSGAHAWCPSMLLFCGLALGRVFLMRDKFSFLDIDRSCPLCNEAEESVKHLFFHC